VINDTLKERTPAMAVLVQDTVTEVKKSVRYFSLYEKTKYTLFIPDSAFMDVFGKYNDSVKISFVTFEKAQTGNLALKITTDTVKQYFYELRCPPAIFLRKAN
jgi:hypothetical protein